MHQSYCFIGLLSAVQLAIAARPACCDGRVSGCVNCEKRTYGYNQVWMPQQASPVIVPTQIYAVERCSMPPYAAIPLATVPYATSTMSGGSAADVETLETNGYIVPSFRLCVVCPANATVIIDGQRTKSTGKVREYKLNLAAPQLGQPVRVIVIDAKSNILWNDVTMAVGGGSDTLFAPIPAAGTYTGSATMQRAQMSVDQVDPVEGTSNVDLGRQESTRPGQQMEAPRPQGEVPPVQQTTP